jgi:hypothetical protein
MMNIFVVFGLGLFIFLVMLIRRTASRQSLPLTADWIDELSMERYRPMMRLLEGHDIEFLKSQPGFTPRMGRQLRQQRCQIFRGYLRCLNADFAKVCAALKLLMLQSREDRPDLAGILIHQQFKFTLGVATIQFRVFLYRFGICGADVSSLIRTFDSMRIELRRLVPATESASA